MTDLSASAALLVVAIGACAYLGVLQLWLGFRVRGPSRWVGAWAAFAVMFAGARLVQLDTAEAQTAILAARAYCACTPLLLWSLCRLVDSVSATQLNRRERRFAAAFACSVSALMLFTPWFVGSAVEPSSDLSGLRYLGVPAGPAMPLVGVMIGVALVWSFRKLGTATELSRAERRGFRLMLALYAAMGLSSLASSLGLIATAGVAEYGPLLVSLGAGQLLAIRQRRLEANLQRQVEERTSALTASQALYRDVIDNAPIGMLSVDARGQLEHANAKLLAILGSTYTEFAGSFSVVDEGAAKNSGFAAMLERALRTGEVLTDQFSFDSWWGRSLTTRTLVAPRRNAAGDVVGALAIVEDVTERLAIESRLQEAQRMEAIGQLAAGVAHEINNPMAYVRSNLTMLREEIDALAKDADSAEQPEQTRARIGECGTIVGNCLVHVERTVSIVRDMREFSRGGSADREPTDVNALLENAARLVSTRTSGLNEIPLQLAEVPPISAAPGQLRQVFLNLLLNALRAAGPTGRVSAATTRTASELLISVHDDGPVIQPAERARLFEPFAPCRGSGADPGLGLYISQQIARDHQGKIEVLSSAEHGTRFIVRLPIPLDER